jgi:hypothetical protein
MAEAFYNKLVKWHGKAISAGTNPAFTVNPTAEYGSDNGLRCRGNAPSKLG